MNSHSVPLTNRKADHAFFTIHLDVLNKVISPVHHKETRLSMPVIDQLKMIYDQMETAWYDNLEKIQGDVKYLLIGESPAWTFHDQASCFYGDHHTSIVDTVKKAFFVSGTDNGVDLYEHLGKRGFLQVNSLPYAFPFTPAQRKSRAYAELIRICMPWWITRLNTCGLSFAPDMKVGFAYYWNGIQVIGASLGTLHIDRKSYPVQSGQIIAGPESRFTPSSAALTRIFNLPRESKYP